MKCCSTQNIYSFHVQPYSHHGIVISVINAKNIAVMNNEYLSIPKKCQASVIQTSWFLSKYFKNSLSVQVYLFVQLEPGFHQFPVMLLNTELE